MSTETRPHRAEPVVYPESDGLPMAENTLQYEWITTIKGGLEAIFRDRPDVFVAGDLFWYPIEGDPNTRTAPDTMVVFGRPPGHRGSYRQWEEGGIPPQVVFEILSPGNRTGEMTRKLHFYDEHGVEEYYLYDPDDVVLNGWQRVGDELVPIADLDGWTSPLLGVRFDLSGPELRIDGPDGRPLQSYLELARQRDVLERQRDELARQRDDLARQREADRLRAEQLAEQLRKLGIEPEA